jgi:hypothetical protein
MHATQTPENPRSSAAWYHFTRPSIVPKIASCTSIARSTAEVRIPIKPATYSD